MKIFKRLHYMYFCSTNAKMMQITESPCCNHSMMIQITERPCCNHSMMIQITENPCCNHSIQNIQTELEFMHLIFSVQYQWLFIISLCSLLGSFTFLRHESAFGIASFCCNQLHVNFNFFFYLVKKRKQKFVDAKHFH